jgi:hypothetical protein
MFPFYLKKDEVDRTKKRRQTGADYFG